MCFYICRKIIYLYTRFIARAGTDMVYICFNSSLWLYVFQYFTVIFSNSGLFLSALYSLFLFGFFPIHFLETFFSHLHDFIIFICHFHQDNILMPFCNVHKKIIIFKTFFYLQPVFFVFLYIPGKIHYVKFLV